MLVEKCVVTIAMGLLREPANGVAGVETWEAVASVEAEDLTVRNNALEHRGLFGLKLKTIQIC